MSNTILIPPLNLGKYPEDHNINGDIMFDLKTRRFFDRDDANSTHAPFWWQDAEPFWSTAAKYGKKVTTDIFNLRRPRHIFFCSFRLQCSTGTHSSVEFLVYSSSPHFRISKMQMQIMKKMSPTLHPFPLRDNGVQLAKSMVDILKLISSIKISGMH